MTLKKEKKKAERKSGKAAQKPPVSKAEAVQQSNSGKDSKQAKQETGDVQRVVGPSRDGRAQADGKALAPEAGGKLERRASLRRKFGALIRGSADLPAAINRSLQPIRRSLSFSKDLNRLHEPPKPYRTTSVQWYNSLGSLAEDECANEPASERNSASDEEEDFPGRAQVTRTQSLLEKNSAYSNSTPRSGSQTLVSIFPTTRDAKEGDHIWVVAGVTKGDFELEADKLVSVKKGKSADRKV
ncbi:hypothetical protein KM043_012401 [Ampulex compressa]|nr:hypothetical protein KM043_012401 [Ampulex compressa]